ncbi:putative trans-sialidase [Trypanosoma conorhini]|uniref:Putative trans-sialidase n=1 Tax=Trypanosoma conorhini TaxID=83891 RepID=A0A422Q186_9TRYP|nr:putative trans-sialidase [Trypanosoma conorhini]RNF23774.1 putative trans-sialidase [Trypanosoma conorhini]
MQRSVKRAASAGADEVPVTRRRLRDGVEAAEAETEAEKKRPKQEAVAPRRAPKDEDEEWEDATDDEQQEEAEDGEDCISVDEGLGEVIEEEIVDEDEDDDEDYAEFQREADAVTKGLRRVTFDADADALQTQQLQKGGDGEEEEAAPTVWRSDQAGEGRSSSRTPTRHTTPSFSCARSTRLSPLM